MARLFPRPRRHVRGDRISWAPWYVLRSNDKKRARLNVISHLLNHVPYEDLPREKVKLPKRHEEKGYVEPDYPYKYVTEHIWG